MRPAAGTVALGQASPALDGPPRRPGDAAPSRPAAGWTVAPERGSPVMMRVMLGITRALGWRAGHLLLYPITAYFLASSPRQRAAARRYLDRALGRKAQLGDLFRLYFAFASTILDRIWLITGRTAAYRIDIHGLEALRARIEAGQGCLLFGAHLGSFEALRAVADAGCPVEVAVLMHEANAAKMKAFFDALGGAQRTAAIIPLGRPDAMLRVQECLQGGGLVGLLADRAAGTDKLVRVPFLGQAAPLPAGPHLLAAVLGAPVMLAFGIWRGPRHYEVHFEPFAEQVAPGGRAGREAAVAESVARYAARLEATCRAHPYNWFNFFDVWAGEGAR